ncbi:unnamed protein product [Heligmosomoides polygyrus]|uniref:Reverse transcriptase domain-containing protein n=1 Tax=Heligmosomoides polygyrus TaxID=6339 RepID=A0A183G3M5_HELPZ|nr:unnamed protein product [Heligmosomoides polygyrus]
MRASRISERIQHDRPNAHHYEVHRNVARVDGFTTKISPFYNDIVIDVKRGVRQGDTISPKLFSATHEDGMRELEWEDMGVQVDGRQLHQLRFADDIVLITPITSQAERMLTDFDRVCGNVGLQLNFTKTMFMRNGQVSDAPFSLNGKNVSVCSSYVYLDGEVNTANDRAPELSRRKREAWGAFKSVEEVAKKTKNVRLRAHLFDSAVLTAPIYSLETWAIRKTGWTRSTSRSVESRERCSEWHDSRK